MISKPHETPALVSDHLRDAKLYATREDQVRALAPTRPDTIAEIGVAFGDFSEFLIQALQPTRFVAFDIFDIHEAPTYWGRPTEDIFLGKTHREYYESRLSGSPTELVIEEGLSADRLSLYPARSFDLIYVDAGHGYASVSADLALSADKLTAEGLLLINDYTWFDPFEGVEYGVVSATNELIAPGGWVVVGFSLHPYMFCDIALKRA